MTQIYNHEMIKKTIIDSIFIKQSILDDSLVIEKILSLANECVRSIRSGGKILFCGNGGSFADAQHLSAEFTSRFLFDRPGLPSMALGTNSSAMTAIGNDYGYENVFAREIEAIASPNDVIIAITTSGNSYNIQKAVDVANAKKILIVVLTGSSSGRLPKMTKTINVPSTDTARIQESHILIGHIICEIVEGTLFTEITTTNAN
jgi:D-sedoheptulose 7-phosphate isomerase